MEGVKSPGYSPWSAGLSGGSRIPIRSTQVPGHLNEALNMGVGALETRPMGFTNSPGAHIFYTGICSTTS